MNIGFHDLLYRYKNAGEKVTIKNPNFKLFIDKGVYTAGLLGVIVILPQIMTIWIDKNITGVSMPTWIGFLLGSSFWLFYGLIHKEKPIIYTNLVVIMADLMVVAGLLFVK